MATREEEFLARLREAFAIEAAEHLSAMSAGLLRLEKTTATAAQTPLIEEIFREAHSLKGAARAVNVGEIETLCQALESVFALWKKHGATATPDDFDVLHQALDCIDQILQTPAVAPEIQAQIPQLVQKLEQLAATQSAATPPAASSNGHRNGHHPTKPPASTCPPETAAPIEEKAPEITTEAKPEAAKPVVEKVVAEKSAHETVRIATAKLDALLLQAEELLSVKLTTQQRAGEMREAVQTLNLWHSEWAKVSGEARLLRRALEKRDENPASSTLAASDAQLARLSEFLEWNRDYLKNLEARLAALTQACDHDRRALGGLVDGLLETSKKLVMLPFSMLLGGFPKLVRDLARDQDKEIELLISGDDIEIDKRILEEMKDPLVHLLRNAADHGIEMPAARRDGGKPARATIAIAITQSRGSEVEIAIRDDGGGIDIERVKKSAVAHGFISPSEAQNMSEERALDLIFQSEVSSSQILTEISGRGLGMAIVRERVQHLGGRIQIETQAGKGTTFRIALPLTLTTFRGILVKAAGQILVLPVAGVERVLRWPREEIRRAGHQITIRLQRANGPQWVPLLSLADVLQLDPISDTTRAPMMSLVVLAAGETVAAFEVDEILNEQEVLVKKLNKPLLRVRHLAAATVLGSGQAAFILHAADLLQSATRTQSSQRKSDMVESEIAAPKSVLVAEDSITSRLLLKTILESAGYQVTTAVDGVDALTKLHEGACDVLVSDVDMPRLNGLDLTQKVRADAQLSELPVILVTARGTREDRERGIEVGANAYLVKSNFDQSSLLEAIRRLI